MAAKLVLLGLAVAAGWYMLRPDTHYMQGVGAGANVPSPSSDATRTPFTLPDGRVISTHPAVALAMLQAVQTGDPAYIRTTAHQLRGNGWPVEADALIAVASTLTKKG